MNRGDSIDPLPIAKHSALLQVLIHLIFKPNLSLKMLSLSTVYRLGNEGRAQFSNWSRAMLLTRSLRFQSWLSGDNQFYKHYKHMRSPVSPYPSCCKPIVRHWLLRSWPLAHCLAAEGKDFIAVSWLLKLLFRVTHIIIVRICFLKQVT